MIDLSSFLSSEQIDSVPSAVSQKINEALRMHDKNVQEKAMFYEDENTKLKKAIEEINAELNKEIKVSSEAKMMIIKYQGLIGENQNFNSKNKKEKPLHWLRKENIFLKNKLSISSKEILKYQENEIKMNAQIEYLIDNVDKERQELISMLGEYAGEIAYYKRRCSELQTEARVDTTNEQKISEELNKLGASQKVYENSIYERSKEIYELRLVNNSLTIKNNILNDYKTKYESLFNEHIQLRTISTFQRLEIVDLKESIKELKSFYNSYLIDSKTKSVMAESFIGSKVLQSIDSLNKLINDKIFNKIENYVGAIDNKETSNFEGNKIVKKEDNLIKVSNKKIIDTNENEKIVGNSGENYEYSGKNYEYLNKIIVGNEKKIGNENYDENNNEVSDENNNEDNNEGLGENNNEDLGVKIVDEAIKELTIDNNPNNHNSIDFIKFRIEIESLVREINLNFNIFTTIFNKIINKINPIREFVYSIISKIEQIENDSKKIVETDKLKSENLSLKRDISLLKIQLEDKNNIVELENRSLKKQLEDESQLKMRSKYSDEYVADLEDEIQRYKKDIQEIKNSYNNFKELYNSFDFESNKQKINELENIISQKDAYILKQNLLLEKYRKIKDSYLKLKAEIK